MLRRFVLIEGRIVSGIYEGPDPTLLGKSALIRTLPHRKDVVLAQFDDTSVGPSKSWTPFPVEDWTFRVQLDCEVECADEKT